MQDRSFIYSVLGDPPNEVGEERKNDRVEGEQEEQINVKENPKDHCSNDMNHQKTRFIKHMKSGLFSYDDELAKYDPNCPGCTRFREAYKKLKRFNFELVFLLALLMVVIISSITFIIGRQSVRLLQ